MDMKDLIEESKSVENVSTYIQAFDFEIYDIVGMVERIRNHRPFMYSIVGIYLTGIYYGQKWMKGRTSFSLNVPLFFWNFLLALFSMIASVRLLPEFLHHFWKPEGIYHVGCTAFPHNYATSFWSFLFMLSKFLELGDTVFIVLRKQRLITLHWFHHIATLFICWIGFEYYDTRGRLMVLNTVVHSFMYSYYALKALKFKIPKKVSMMLTTIQIVQMFLFVFLCSYPTYIAALGHPCRGTMEVSGAGAGVAVIFTILFLNFFKQTYWSGEREEEVGKKLE